MHNTTTSSMEAAPTTVKTNENTTSALRKIAGRTLAATGIILSVYAIGHEATTVPDADNFGTDIVLLLAGGGLALTGALTETSARQPEPDSIELSYQRQQ